MRLSLLILPEMRSRACCFSSQVHPGSSTSVVLLGCFCRCVRLSPKKLFACLWGTTSALTPHEWRNLHSNRDSTAYLIEASPI
jgi:hypothetical protein